MKRLCKIIALSMALFVGCAFTVPAATGTLESHAASKVKISKKKATIVKGKTLQLKMKGTKKKVKWTSSKKKVATVNKKGKVTAKKAGKTVITAKIGNKKYKCKITVKNPTVNLNKTKVTAKTGASIKLKATTNGKSKRIKWKSSNSKIASVTSKGIVYANRVGTATITATANGVSARCKVTVTAAVDPVGSRTNPANPRNGVTVQDTFGTMYFKLTSVLRGENAINKLNAMGEWGEYDQEEYNEHPGTTLTLFIYDVKAVSGYNTYPLSGSDIIHPMNLYNGSCNATINAIDAKYLNNGYESKDRALLELYGGASSDMYMALYVPNNITSFSNVIYDNNFNPYWVKYSF
ncbi:MAG: Ig-like domain-containing protein [Clostridiales Family XIII bacterium]|uniref:Ig-like domain-containing protein n=1 Tax=Hominibacterium faecale TaxID=2839743 RepID=A0A9J6QTS7_9FIRM|nr:Ig-like domain-containing protein [Hominibacterium faecale]MCI7302201.1 Ig-like domain-containing protein [Clostridia bacterium]MCU7379549.1 Ig-like domain-containing protein [Hominibacterium faecale]MDY3009667.1 Ig-like domain-containing protein [Clostridiales Family XIII bacterium]